MQTPEDNNTPLHNILLSDGPITEDFVSRHIVHIDVPSLTNTPLLLAIKTGNMDAALLFVKKGAKVDCVDSWGLTPLHWAAVFRNKKLSDALIAKGLNPYEPPRKTTRNENLSADFFQNTANIIYSNDLNPWYFAFYARYQWARDDKRIYSFDEFIEYLKGISIYEGLAKNFTPPTEEIYKRYSDYLSENFFIDPPESPKTLKPIIGIEYCTDLIFHFDLISKNFLQNNLHNSREYSRSVDQFRDTTNRYLMHFCRQRNELPKEFFAAQNNNSSLGENEEEFHHNSLSSLNALNERQSNSLEPLLIEEAEFEESSSFVSDDDEESNLDPFTRFDRQIENLLEDLVRLNPKKCQVIIGLRDKIVESRNSLFSTPTPAVAEQFIKTCLEAIKSVEKNLITLVFSGQSNLLVRHLPLQSLRRSFF